MIYLDYQATTPIDPQVLRRYTKYQVEYYANPSSNHFMGRRCRRRLEESRKKILEFAGADNNDVYFTGSASAAINIILKSLIITAPAGKRKILALKTEHKAMLETLKELEKHGFIIELLDVMKNGLVDVDMLSSVITNDTLMLVTMHANNEIGVIQPIKQIGRICEENDVLFMVDGAQSFGKLETRFNDDHIDFFIASSHKLYGPKGIAVFIASTKGASFLHTFIHGGGQEKNVVSGTENLPSIMAFVDAIEKSVRVMSKEQARVLYLRNHLISTLKKNVKGLTVNGDLKKRLAGNISLTIDGVTNQILIEQINNEFMISAASACTTALSKQSHVLLAIGLDMQAVNSTVRISIGRFTTKAEINKLIAKLAEKIICTRQQLLFN